MRAARERYFAANGFDEGGYAARVVRLQAGPIPFWILNTKGRVRAVRLHDLHHVATGYETSWTGEAEIGAWELAAGCGRYAAAWFLNGSAALIGLFVAPRRTREAWRRGRQRKSLYASGWEAELLDETVGALRRRLGVPAGGESGAP